MGLTSKSDRPITPDNIQESFTFPPSPFSSGVEREALIIVKDENHCRPLNQAENTRFFEALQNYNEHSDTHLSATQEPNADTIEIVSPGIGERTPTDHLRNIDIQQRGALEILHSKVTSNAFISPWSVQVLTSAKDTKSHLIVVKDEKEYGNRPRLLMDIVGRCMPELASSYPVMNTAVHYTFALDSLAHCHSMINLAGVLYPWAQVITENRPPYQPDFEGSVSEHTGITYKAALEDHIGGEYRLRSLIPEFAFATDPDDFLQTYKDKIFLTPLLLYRDHDGVLHTAPDDEILTPIKMGDHGPENMGQFSLAQSQLWYFFRLKTLTDEEGKPHTGLLELRDFDTGPEVIKNVSLVYNAAASSKTVRDKILSILQDKYGIPVMLDKKRTNDIVQKMLENAHHRGANGKRHLDTPFGDPEKGLTMYDFQKDIVAILEDYYRGTPEEEFLETMRFFADGGELNTEFWARIVKSEAHQRKIIGRFADSSFNSLEHTDCWAEMEQKGLLPDLTP